VDEERRRIQLVKQRIGLGHFPSTQVHDADLIFEGNRESWAALKRAEETYLSQIPLRRGSHGNLKYREAIQADELIRNSLLSMIELSTILLDDARSAETLVRELTKRVEDYYSRVQRPSRK
jgi:hypothetical protein